MCLVAVEMASSELQQRVKRLLQGDGCVPVYLVFDCVLLRGVPLHTKPFCMSSGNMSSCNECKQSMNSLGTKRKQTSMHCSRAACSCISATWFGLPYCCFARSSRNIFVLQHIMAQYEELKRILDALVTAYPQQLQASWLSWEAYLWAVQLWYAHAMQVSA